MFHIFHKFTDWAITERGDVHDDIYKRNKVGVYITQERYCLKCGKTQVKLSKSTLRNDVIYLPLSAGIKPKHDKVKT